VAAGASLNKPVLFWKEHPLRPLRLVSDGTTIQFMRGRFAGVIGSSILSTLSVVLFFYPGLNLGVDFRGGVVVELRGQQALQVDTIREAFAPLGFGVGCRSSAHHTTS
jgi:preprotein translocase subunit SecF